LVYVKENQKLLTF